MLYLMNAIPNSLIIPEEMGESNTVTRWPEDVARSQLEEGFISAIGHASTANAISRRTNNIIKVNRIALVFELTGRPNEVLLHPGDCLLVAAVKTPRRLPEGELYTEEEILAMPIMWAFVQL